MENVAAVPKHAPVAEALCPRCTKPLADPRGLGWCQACGYCRTLEEDCAHLPLAKPAAKEPAAPQPPSTAPANRSTWPIVLIVGVVLLAVICFAASRFVPLTPLQRATWTSVQIALGVLLVLEGQCYALIVLAPKDEKLNFIDAIVPFRLYGLVCENLPRLRLTLWFSSWGLTMVFSALICVGGLSHWLTVLPKSSDSQQTK
jgi:hypothetical protein